MKQFVFIISLLTGVLLVQAQTNEKPNILWLTSEDNNVNWIGSYGNPEARTPNIDKLASEGFQYMNAFANAPVCAPSRGSWITGMYALTLGIQPMRSRNEIPHDEIKYYPDILRERGYYTGNDSKTDYNIGGRPDGDCWNNQGKVKWDEMKHRQPFFQVINSLTSHESRAQGDVENTEFDPENVVLAKYHPDLLDIRKNYAKYHDSINKMDSEIGAALAKLEEMGLADNTIVIYNSDHGGVMPRSKRFLFDNSIHCPLIIRIPEKFKHFWPNENTGTKVDRMVSFIDMPKTWLSITGAEVPSNMQGKIFLGDEIEKENEYHFAYSGRQGDRLDEMRAVRDKRYFFIKNYMPYVRWGQYAEYLWKMKATQAWDAYHKAGKTDTITGRFFRVKSSVEELYDIENDPDNIHNLIDIPENAKIASRMRKSLREWQVDIYDSGLLPEEERAKRAADNNMTIYEFVRNPKLFDLKACLDAADLALEKNPENLSKLNSLFENSESGVRYWGVVGYIMLGDKLMESKDKIIKLLNDESHEVQAMAAWYLYQIGEKEVSLECLKELINTNTYAAMKTLTVVHWIGKDAKVLIPALQSMKVEGKYTIRKKKIVLESLGG
ncbi:MAG: sulfatase-like hydrolase/transferase [Maribacter sp.]